MLPRVRPLLLTCLLALLPLAFGYWVNTHAPYPPSRARAAAHCTRYCARHYCSHATRATSPAYFQLRPLYAATVRALAAGGRSRYAAVNIGFYLGLMPLLLGWLTYGVLRDGQLLSRLKPARKS
jgi:hypothetical protein